MRITDTAGLHPTIIAYIEALLDVLVAQGEAPLALIEDGRPNVEYLLNGPRGGFAHRVADEAADAWTGRSALTALVIHADEDNRRRVAEALRRTADAIDANAGA